MHFDHWYFYFCCGDLWNRSGAERGVRAFNLYYRGTSYPDPESLQYPRLPCHSGNPGALCGAYGGDAL